MNADNNKRRHGRQRPQQYQQQQSHPHKFYSINKSDSTTTSTSHNHPRIPLALQRVFVRSNQGEVVDDAPKEASKTFFRRIFRWRPGRRRQKKDKVPEPVVQGSSNDSTTSTTSHSSRQSRGRGATVKQDTTAALTPPRKLSQSPTKRKAPQQQISPQAYLNSQLAARGYDTTTTYSTLSSGYHSTPTPLQKASYDAYLIDLVKLRAIKSITGIFDTGILSPNPCNQFGESLLHLVCRLGDAQILDCLLAAGCTIQVSDDYGRTPLHDACWGNTPSFDLLDRLLSLDLDLLRLKDARGALPLEYCPKHVWGDYRTFLASKLDVYWPVPARPRRPPVLALRGNTTDSPTVDSHTMELARLLCSGRLRPEEAVMLRARGDEESSSDDESDDEESSSSSASSSDYSGSELSSDFDDDDDFTLRGMKVKVPMSKADMLRQTELLLASGRQQQTTRSNHVQPESNFDLLDGAC